MEKAVYYILSEENYPVDVFVKKPIYVHWQVVENMLTSPYAIFYSQKGVSENHYFLLLDGSEVNSLISESAPLRYLNNDEKFQLLENKPYVPKDLKTLVKKILQILEVEIPEKLDERKTWVNIVDRIILRVVKKPLKKEEPKVEDEWGEKELEVEYFL